jgi:hypothetical protein
VIPHAGADTTTINFGFYISAALIRRPQPKPPAASRVKIAITPGASFSTHSLQCALICSILQPVYNKQAITLCVE